MIPPEMLQLVMKVQGIEFGVKEAIGPATGWLPVRIAHTCAVFMQAKVRYVRDTRNRPKPSALRCNAEPPADARSRLLLMRNTMRIARTLLQPLILLFALLPAGASAQSWRVDELPLELQPWVAWALDGDET